MTEQEQKELNTQLLKGIAEGNLKRVIELLEMGADIEANDNGNTALHIAVIYKDLEIMRELLRRGADIEATNNNGCTALFLARVYKNVKVIKELLEHGETVDLYTLCKYPELSIDKVHEQVKMEDKWASAFMLIIREQDKYSEEEFKKYVLEFIQNTNTELPNNIKIILNTLI